MIKTILVTILTMFMISCGGDDNPSPHETLIEQYKSTILGSWIPPASICDIVVDHNAQHVFRGMRHEFTSANCTMTQHCFMIDQFGPKTYKFIAASNGEVHIEIYNVGRFIVKELDQSHLYFVSVSDFPAGSQFDLYLDRE